MIEVHIPDSTPMHVQIGNRLRQQIEDAHQAVQELGTREAQRTLRFTMQELENLIGLYG